MVRYSSLLPLALRAEQGETGCPGGAGNRSLKISNWRLGISALAITENRDGSARCASHGTQKEGCHRTVDRTVEWRKHLTCNKVKKRGGAPQRGPGDQEIGCTSSAKSTPGLNALSLLDSGWRGGAPTIRNGPVAGRYGKRTGRSPGSR